MASAATWRTEAAERQREMEERTRKMMEEERARNDMQARAMVHSNETHRAPRSNHWHRRSGLTGLLAHRLHIWF